MKNLIKLFAFLSILLANCNTIIAQVGIGNTNPKSTLDISSSSIITPIATDGLLIPRMNTFPATNPAADQQSMLVYLTTDLTGINISGTAQNYSKGFYFWENTISNWSPLSSSSSNAWSLAGNTGTDGGTSDFLGTTDNQPLSIRTNNVERFKFTTNNQLEFINPKGSTFIGENAGGAYQYTGTAEPKRNVFIGQNAGANYVGNLGISTDNTNNTAIGADAMGKTTQSGGRNTAIGSYALENITGTYNVAIGTLASNMSTIATKCTAIGNRSLENNDRGNLNTATGYMAMRDNVNGGNNVATGVEALKFNVSGYRNVAIGSESLLLTTNSHDNVAVGYYALAAYQQPTTALEFGQNTAIGGYALSSAASSRFNTALGMFAGYGVTSGNNNTFIGVKAGERTTSSTTVSNSVFIGNGSGTDSTANDLLFIENSVATTPLIGGDFANDKVGINIDISTPANLTHTLTVGGDVKAVDFEATASGTIYADYVFEDYFGKEATINKDYRFTPLNNAIAFVKENGHLPNVKSYNEIKANNFEISLTETSLKNLEKIEENFLYIAELKTENNQLKKDNLELKEKISNIEVQQAEILKLLKEEK